MSGKTLVVVYEQGDSKRGEISIVENPVKAARLVETLLEAGFQRNRIRIFTGDEMGMQVTHRPVVALLDGAADSGDSRETTEDAPPPAPKAKAEAEEVAAKSSAKDTQAPLTKDGVHFSQAFRTA